MADESDPRRTPATLTIERLRADSTTGAGGCFGRDAAKLLLDEIDAVSAEVERLRANLPQDPRLGEALRWALDLIDQYDEFLIALGENRDSVYSEVHLAGKAKAHAALANLPSQRDDGEVENVTEVMLALDEDAADAEAEVRRLQEALRTIAVTLSLGSADASQEALRIARAATAPTSEPEAETT